LLKNPGSNLGFVVNGKTSGGDGAEKAEGEVEVENRTEACSRGKDHTLVDK